MNETEYHDVLTSLRCDANMMRDSAFPDVREAAIRMLAVIDSALSSEPPRAVEIAAIASIPPDVLIREMRRLVCQVKREQKMCSRCHSRPARAHGICKACYKKAYRRGEFGNARR